LCVHAYICILHIYNDVQLKGLEDDAVIAAYVLSLDGRNWKKLWYQVKTDFVLYKFKAHEVRSYCTHAVV